MKGNGIGARRPLGFDGSIVPWGTHLLGFFDLQDALDQAALRFMEAGLVTGDRCLWIYGGDGSLERIRRVIWRFSPLASQLVGTEAFAVVPFRDWYFPSGGTLDGGAVLERWSEQSDVAADGGFSGLRVFAEVDVRTDRELDQMVDYETHVGESLHGLHLITVCLYPLRKVSADAFKRLRGAHDVMVSTPETAVTLFPDDLSGSRGA